MSFCLTEKGILVQKAWFHGLFATLSCCYNFILMCDKVNLHWKKNDTTTHLYSLSRRKYLVLTTDYSSIFTFTFIASFRTDLETVCAHNIYILFIAKSNCSLWLCIFSMLGLKTYHFCLYYTKLATLIMTFLKLSSHQKYTGSISIVDLLASHVCNGAFSLIRTHKKLAQT